MNRGTEIRFPTAFEWDMSLKALSSGDLRSECDFACAALRACGGRLLSCCTGSCGFAALTFDFPRSACVEIYFVLAMCGLALTGESHRRMIDLCQCTRALLAPVAEGRVRVELAIESADASGLDPFAEFAPVC
jgi:hypothetical protein